MLVPFINRVYPEAFLRHPLVRTCIVITYLIFVSLLSYIWFWYIFISSTICASHVFIDNKKKTSQLQKHSVA